MKRYEVRKCIYTGAKAEAKDYVLPKKIGEMHNWANKAPISLGYQEMKEGRLPTELEVEANRIFKMLELAKLDVAIYEAKLIEIQEEILRTTEIKKDIRDKKAKEKEEKREKEEKERQIDDAYIEKEALEEAEKAMEEVIKKKKTMWD